MTCAAFSQVRGHDAAEGSSSAGDDVGRVRREFGWEGLCQARTRAQTRNESCAAADCDLIFGVVSENMLADARSGVNAAAGVVDIDQSAPAVDEFLVADDSAEPPDGGLIDGECFGSKRRLRVGGDEEKAGLNGVMVCDGLDEVQDHQNAYVGVYFGGICTRTLAVRIGADVQRPAVDDACDVAFLFEVRFEQLAQLLGLPRVQRVPTVDFC